MRAIGRTRHRRTHPYLIAGGEVERKQPSSLGRTQRASPGRHLQFYVGQRYIVIAPIRSGSPLYSSERGSMADALLPKNFSFLIGIDSVDHARLLAEQQHSLSLSERNQDGRIADVEI